MSFAFRKNALNFGCEAWQFRCEISIAFGSAGELEEFFSDQVPQRLLQPEPLPNAFGGCALFNPYFVGSRVNQALRVRLFMQEE